MKKLRCDRCGLELTEIDEIDVAYEGMMAWHASARARVIEPRGIIPCKHYIRCGGEIRVVAGNGFFWWRRWTARLFSR